MRYTEARAILSEAIELLSEGSSMDNKYSNKSYNSMENKPSTNKMEKPTKPVAKPSAQGRATNSPVVKFGKRTTSRRYVTRANRWALRQIAKNKSAVSEAIDQLGEGRKTFAQRSASLIQRMGGSPEEIRQGITGKRTPAAKSGRALLTKAQKAAERKRERDPDYPYGKAETRRMSKYMSESELDEATRAEIKRAAAHNAKFAKIRAKNKDYLERNKKRAAAEGGVGGILHKFRGFLGSSKSK